MYGTTGFIVTIGKSPITWTSRKQSIRVLSSSATEYIAADTALDDALWISSWIRSMNTKLGKEVIKGFPLLLTDSAPCIRMTTNRSIERNQPKFVDLRQLHILDRFLEKKFNFQWVSGKDNPADILTKNTMTIAHFTKLRDMVTRGDANVMGE